MDTRGRRPTYADVVSTLAVCLALGGGAVYTDDSLPPKDCIVGGYAVVLPWMA